MAKRSQPTADKDLVGQVMRDFSQDETSHNAFITKVEARYKAYRAVLELQSTAAGWESSQHPPYVFQIIETILASVVDPQPGWKIRPRPRMADQAQLEQLRNGAKANELLLNQQADTDRLGEKQVAFAKQCLITGLSVYKTYWRYGEQVRPRQALQWETQRGVAIPRTSIQSRVEVSHDDPCCEVVDVRDFIWHEAAISLERAKRVTHRVLYTIEELHALQAAGVYRNVGLLSDTDDTGPAISTREQTLFETNRAKDMVEVLEQWRRTEDGMRVTAVGNRNVLLRDDPNPFWHGQFPFVICSSVPDLFRIPGISDVELIQDLQEIAWTLLNQRLDNTALLNNAIVLIADDSEEPDQFEWAPGAQWFVPRPVGETVKTLEVSALPTEISFNAEDRVKQDMQNIPGASPSLLGQFNESRNTATETSLVTSLGQRRLLGRKKQFQYAHGRVGDQWLSLNQQFVRDKRLIDVIGQGGEVAFHEVSPLLIQGDYAITLESMDESLLRQERKAESSATLQIALSAAPVFAALSQGGQQPMLNMKAFMDDVLEASGITDKDRYYVAPHPQQPQPPSPGGGPAPSQNGVSAPQATDMNSPSNQFSQSPVGALQRLNAMAGGPANVPNG